MGKIAENIVRFHHEAVQIMVSDSGTFFDPDLIEIFLKLHDKFDEIFNKH